MMLSPAALERRFVLLTALRWLPVGLLIPISVLYALDRGLGIAELGLAASIQGIVVLILELPSGGLADSWGRRPVLIAASSVSLIAVVTLSFAQSFPAFVAVYALQGVFRALDSGALEAWFADAAIAAGGRATVDKGLAAAGAAIGIGIGGGAILSSGITLIAPALGVDPLQLPIWMSAALTAGYLGVVIAFVHEDRIARASTTLATALRGVPRMLGDGIRLLRSSRILRALIGVELFWGFGMYAFESLTPVKLADVVGDADAAAAMLGPVTAAGWLLFSGGSALMRALSGRFNVALMAALFRVLQGATVVALGLVAGPTGVIVAFIACYAAHGASNPLHNTLLHAQVTGQNRATVLSMNSMIAFPAGSLGAIVLGGIAGGVSLTTAFIVAGIVLALAAPLYLPAWRAGRVVTD